MINERTCGAVADCHAYLLAAAGLGIGAVIEIILVFSLAHLHFLYGWRPQISVRPGYLTVLGIEHFALVTPLLEVGRREALVSVTAPTGCAVGGGIDIIAVCLVAIRYLRIGMKAGENGVLLSLHLRRAEREREKNGNKNILHISFVFICQNS